MKFYCIEFDMCGWSAQTLEPEDHADLVCPVCSSLLLMYEDSQTPEALLEERALTRSAAAAHDS